MGGVEIMPTITIKPNADGANNEWDYTGAISRTLAISKETIQPNTPSLTSKIFTPGQANYQEHELEEIVNAETITQIEIWIYGQADNPPDPTTNIQIVTPNEIINCGDINLTDEAGWKHLTISDLNITKTDFDSTYIRIISGDYGGNNGNIHQIYLDVTYTEPEPEPSENEPLPKRRKTMSGYNYFIRNYILRKNKELTPYKLPDGTLFEE